MWWKEARKYASLSIGDPTQGLAKRDIVRFGPEP
jgi:hypothetical protein